MITLTQLQVYLDGYLNFDNNLDIPKIDPFMTNGLMVRGKEEVRRIGFGVSASRALFEKAISTQCDTLIVHHSFNLPPFNRHDEIFQNRFGFLIKNELSLFGYHFLLDAHPEAGNNVEILKKIGAKPTAQFFHHGNPWGWIGEFKENSDLSTIEQKLKTYLSPRLLIYRSGTQSIKRIVAISGKGAPIASDIQYLLDEKIDLYITGEAHEWNRELFREAKINFIAGGHYATEKFGLNALKEKVKDHFPDVVVEWLEVANEV